MIYAGYTHHVPGFLLPLWKRIFCRRHWHAWDEVATAGERYFSCDACGEVEQLRAEGSYAKHGKIRLFVPLIGRHKGKKGNSSVKLIILEPGMVGTL